MLELADCAEGPLEALAGVPEVAHDEAVLPAALDGARAPEVGGRGGAVVHCAQSRESRSVEVLRLVLRLSENFEKIV